MIKRISYITLTVLWMALIFAFSSQSADVSGAASGGLSQKILAFFIENPSPELVGIFETVIRKIAHFTEYAVLSALAYLSVRSFGIAPKKAAFSVAIAIFYSITDEIHQHFVPGRACRLFDVFIDSLGATFGYFASFGISLLKRKKQIKN